MLDVEVSLKNYRCFGDEPVRMRISDGFTALIGVNNSGKSSLLRSLYEIRPLLQGLANRSGGWGHELLNGRSVGHVWHPTLVGGERIIRAGAAKPAEIELTVYDGPEGAFTLKDGTQLSLLVRYGPSSGTEAELRTSHGGVIKDWDKESSETIATEPFMAAMAELASTMYVGPFRNAIHIGAQAQYYDISTGDAFIKRFAEFKAGPVPEQNEAAFQLVAELRRIFGFESLEVNPNPENNTLQMTVDGRSFRLAEQGAGLAHFLVVLVNVLTARPSLLLIDEPELNLHASLQLDFLTTLGRYTGSGVVFATHSLGLARTAADRIYTLKKSPNGSSTVRQYESDTELVTLLGQLAFDRRPELGFNKVLLVEGKTELRAVMQLLRLYKKEHEVLLLPLHGDSLIQDDVGQELAELCRIGGNIKYLIDSERTAKGQALATNRQGFVDLCKGLNIDGLVLERRALENYFPADAIERAIGPRHLGLAPYEKKAARQGWSKKDNWRIAAQMHLDDLAGTDLGDFLQKL